MSYSITVLTKTNASDTISAILFMQGAEGVTIYDHNDVVDIVEHRFSTYWDYIDDALLTADDVVRVIGYFTEKPTEVLLSALKESLAAYRAYAEEDAGSLEVILSENHDDQDWYNNWKSFYKPIHVDDITVLPAWEQTEEAGTIVRINPCMAFGTGQHESTQMCLKLLQRVDVVGKQLLDIGCGSGILGIAGLLRGASHCYFADIDPDAMKNMVENAALNRVDNYQAATASLADGCSIMADLVLANITADILISFAPQAYERLKQGGTLIISGIIAEREDEVLSAFSAVGFIDRDCLSLGDWRAHLLTK